MHFSLALAIGVLSIIHVQSQIPNRCQMGMTTLISVLGEVATKLNAEKYGHLHAQVSQIALKLQQYSNRQRTAQNTGASMGTREGCLKAMDEFYAQLKSIETQLNGNQNDRMLTDASSGIKEAIKFVEEMKECRKNH